MVILLSCFTHEETKTQRHMAISGELGFELRKTPENIIKSCRKNNQEIRIRAKNASSVLNRLARKVSWRR